ncbi:kinase-like protein [Marasmius fiardii PR-910]|nr:kinase-like protein [Marasmius fiardii PR-910]
MDEELGQLQASLQGIFQDKAKLAVFLDQKGEDAQNWLDRLQVLVDYPNVLPQLRSSIFEAMIRLSKKSGLHPKCLLIQNVHKLGAHPIAAGGSGDVWKGIIGEPPGRTVCLKVVKVYLTSDIEQLFQGYLREAIVWRQLKHPNLLPFLGMYYLEDETQFCLVSPWMDKGNLVQFLRATQREHVNHHELVYDVASGLAYLHSEKVVHGDLKGVNILITPDGRACIGDFGLSRVADTHGLNFTSSHSRPAGTARWLAPELLRGGHPSKQSDIYAFGCVCYEIFTGLHPFPDVRNEMTVLLQVVSGERPSRPLEITELSDAMWTLIGSCWDADSSSRPTATILVEQVRQMCSRTPVESASNWNDSVFAHQIWDNVQHPPLLNVSEFHPEQIDRSQHNVSLLMRLIRTEQNYLNVLEGLVKKAAAAWSRDNMPPIILDAMFRTAERIYRSHRAFFSELQAANARRAYSGVLELVMRWPRIFVVSYTSYVQSYHSALDDWEPVVSNTRLNNILSRLSLTKITGASWTLDELFLLPIGRLKYFKMLYSWLLEEHSSLHNILLESLEKVDRLLEIYDKRKDVKASSASASLLTGISRSPAKDDADGRGDEHNFDIPINTLSADGSALNNEASNQSASNSQYVTAFTSSEVNVTRESNESRVAQALSSNYQPSRSPSPVSPSKEPDGNFEFERLSPAAHERRRTSPRGSPFQQSRSPSPDSPSVEPKAGPFPST